jgi:ankyrin repeat protein
VERLIQENADVDAGPAGSNGRTALQTAIEGGHVAVVERLIQENADANAGPAKYDGRTALQALPKEAMLV